MVASSICSPAVRLEAQAPVKPATATRTSAVLMKFFMFYPTLSERYSKLCGAVAAIR
jgi:hypothetical protein